MREPPGKRDLLTELSALARKDEGAEEKPPTSKKPDMPTKSSADNSRASVVAGVSFRYRDEDRSSTTSSNAVVTPQVDASMDVVLKLIQEESAKDRAEKVKERGAKVEIRTSGGEPPRQTARLQAVAGRGRHQVCASANQDGNDR